MWSAIMIVAVLTLKVVTAVLRRTSGPLASLAGHPRERAANRTQAV